MDWRPCWRFVGANMIADFFLASAGGHLIAHVGETAGRSPACLAVAIAASHRGEEREGPGIRRFDWDLTPAEAACGFARISIVSVSSSFPSIILHRMIPMKHCVVTGGAGFIGSHLVEALLARGDRVSVVDDESTGSIENLAAVLEPSPAQLHQGDRGRRGVGCRGWWPTSTRSITWRRRWACN